MDYLIYLTCLIVGLVFTAFAFLFSHFFGGDHGHIGTGGHAEAGYDHSGIPGFSFFSPPVMASFLTAFGAFGLVLNRIPATRSVWVSAPLAALGGFAVASGVLWVFNTAFKKTESSSEAQVAGLVGHGANTTSTIPENGVGEIAYVLSQSRYTAPARSVDGKAIPAGRPVRITNVEAAEFVVEQVAQH